MLVAAMCCTVTTYTTNLLGDAEQGRGFTSQVSRVSVTVHYIAATTLWLDTTFRENRIFSRKSWGGQLY